MDYKEKQKTFKQIYKESGSWFHISKTKKDEKGHTYRKPRIIGGKK